MIGLKLRVLYLFLVFLPYSSSSSLIRRKVKSNETKSEDPDKNFQIEKIKFTTHNVRKLESDASCSDDGSKCPFGKCGDCYCAPGESGTCPSEFTTAEQFIYTDETISRFRNLQPSFIYDIEPTDDGKDCDPYKQDDENKCIISPTVPPIRDGQVCAFKYHYDNPEVFDSRKRKNLEICPISYSPITYDNRTEAEKDGSFITHEGRCGLCSTAQDLAAYISLPDMTTDGKVCATKALLFGHKAGLKCFMNLGFSEPCAKTWLYNAVNTGKVCRFICIEKLFSANNCPPPPHGNCELNKCLQCDEDKSGPIFKEYAGRTRRRSNLLAAIVRSCDDIAEKITHNPCPSLDSISSIEQSK